MKIKYISLPLLFVACLASCQTSYQPGVPLTITSIEMCDQYGESTLIQFGSYDIVVDTGAGADASHVKAVLNQKVSDKEIDLLILTHPHGDHIGGIINGAINGFSVKQIVDYGYTYDTNDNGTIDNSSYVQSYVNYRNNLIKKGASYLGIKETVEQSDKLVIDKKNDLILHWLHNDFYVGMDDVFPNKQMSAKNPNTTSVSFSLQYKKWHILMCGDVDSTLGEFSILVNEEKLFKKGSRVILKANHHASSSSMGYNFMEWCNPEMMFVSAAMVDGIIAPNPVVLGNGDGQQNHPNKSAVKRMKEITEEIYWNGINGDLTITIDGVNDYIIEGAGRHKNYYKKGTTELANVEEEKNVTLLNSEFGKYY